MSCDSKDITDLIFHVTLQDHLVEGHCDFVQESSSLYDDDEVFLWYG